MKIILRFIFTIATVFTFGASFSNTLAVAANLDLPGVMVPQDESGTTGNQQYADETKRKPAALANPFNKRGRPGVINASADVLVLPETGKASPLNSGRKKSEATVETGVSTKKVTAVKPSTRTTRSLASALYRNSTPAENPYGELHNKRGLWPYKPGQKYDRKNEHGGGLFGSLFGG